MQVVQEALHKANLTERDLSAVAVTIGPGLSLCLRGNLKHILQVLLWTRVAENYCEDGIHKFYFCIYWNTVGVQKARKIAGQFNLPIVGVHHMEAHALVARQGLTMTGMQNDFLDLFNNIHIGQKDTS